MEKIKKIIAIYPGRFQPFGQHHFETFKWLQKQFGVSNTFVATSNKVDGNKSPLNFKEKSAIIQQYGIDKKHIIQVTTPYDSEELMSKFDNKTTGLVVIYGKKDADRIKYIKADGSPGYFQPYTNKNDMLAADQHGYIIVAPNIQINLPGFGEMSGTNLRKFIKDSGPEDFKKVMGWYTDELYNVLKDKFQVEGTQINIDDYIDLFNLNEIVDQSIKMALGEDLIEDNVELISEGGAAGHMSYIIEDTEMTFGDLKQIIKRALSGKLDVEQEVSEKTDGMALSVTYKDGEVRAARNKSTIINPMTMAEVSSKFEGRGAIHDAFVFAMKDLQSALHKIPSDKLHQIFEGGTKFVTLEIIYPDNQMTISYGPGMYLQIHNMTKYDDKGNKLETDPNGANILQKLIKQVNGNIQDKFEIIPPQVLKMNKDLNYETKLNNYTKYINALQSDYGLYDTDPIAEYYLRYWRGYIKSNFGISDGKLTDGLAERFAGMNKNFKLNKQTVPTESILVSLIDFDKNKAAKLQREQVDKFEDVILKVSVDVLENATNYLAASPNEEVKQIRKKLSDAIKHIRASGDLEDISKLKQYIKKLENLGGSQKILPAEGLVFMYKGKMYKMTGSFVPVHRILGLVKFKK